MAGPTIMRLPHCRKRRYTGLTSTCAIRSTKSSVPSMNSSSAIAATSRRATASRTGQRRRAELQWHHRCHWHKSDRFGPFDHSGDQAPDQTKARRASTGLVCSRAVPPSLRLERVGLLGPTLGRDSMLNEWRVRKPFYAVECRLYWRLPTRVNRQAPEDLPLICSGERFSGGQSGHRRMIMEMPETRPATIKRPVWNAGRTLARSAR